MNGRLIVGSMPIGNMDDVTVRMLKAFKDCDIIFSDIPTDYLEKILNLNNLQKNIQKLKSTNSQFADLDQVEEMISLIKKNKTILLVASEGQIGIADPGCQFIQACVKNNLNYTVLPGPSVFSNSYAASGYVEGDFLVCSSMNDPIPFLQKNKELNLPMILLVWYKDIFSVLNFIKKNYDNNRYITLCINMTMENELFIYDTIGEISNNEKIKQLNESSKISLIISGSIEVDFRPPK